MTTPLHAPDSLGSSADCREYAAADWTGDIDVSAVFGGPARRIKVVDVGGTTKLLVVVTASSDGVERTLTIPAAPWDAELQVTKIKAASTVARIQVFA